jgi:heme/copper-type cytochrome/quinol oxidase subunit 4
MNIHSNFKDHVCRFVVSAGIISLAMPAMPNPIPLAKNSIMPEIFFLTAFAILLEVMCINLVLRRSRRPSFFILWLIGMHLITYPSFWGLLWLLQDMRPAFATAIGEGLVVSIEGGVIYLICLFVASARPQLPSPSLAKCWMASFIGNPPVRFGGRGEVPFLIPTPIGLGQMHVARNFEGSLALAAMLHIPCTISPKNARSSWNNKHFDKPRSKRFPKSHPKKLNGRRPFNKEYTYE